jgi:hypothetical protein
MQQGRLITLVNIQSASGPVAGQCSVGDNTQAMQCATRDDPAQLQL